MHSQPSIFVCFLTWFVAHGWLYITKKQTVFLARAPYVSEMKCWVILPMFPYFYYTRKPSREKQRVVCGALTGSGSWPAGVFLCGKKWGFIWSCLLNGWQTDKADGQEASSQLARGKGLLEKEMHLLSCWWGCGSHFFFVDVVHVSLPWANMIVQCVHVVGGRLAGGWSLGSYVNEGRNGLLRNWGTGWKLYLQLWEHVAGRSYCQPCCAHYVTKNVGSIFFETFSILHLPKNINMVKKDELYFIDMPR